MSGFQLGHDPRNTDYFKEGTTNYTTDPRKFGWWLDHRKGHLSTGQVPEIDSKIITDHRRIPGGTRSVNENDLFFLINFHGSIVKGLNTQESNLLNRDVYYITSAKPQYCALSNDSFDYFIYDYFNNNGAFGAKQLYDRNFLESLKKEYIEGHGGTQYTTYDYLEQDVSHLSIDRRRLNHDWSYSLVDDMLFKGLYEINRRTPNALRLLLNKSNGRFEGDENFRDLAYGSDINLSTIVNRIKTLNPRSNIYIFITSCLFDPSVKIGVQGDFLSGEAYRHVPENLDSGFPVMVSGLAKAKRRFTPQRPQQKGVLDYCRDFGECLFGQTSSSRDKVIDYGRDMRRGGKKIKKSKRKTKRKTKKKRSKRTKRR